MRPFPPLPCAHGCVLGMCPQSIATSVGKTARGDEASVRSKPDVTSAVYTLNQEVVALTTEIHRNTAVIDRLQ